MSVFHWPSLTATISGSVTADTELNTDDLDTGAGTDTQAIIGLALAESGGHTLVGSANPMPVSDAGSSLTVDTTGTSGLEVVQTTHDDLNLNANIQQGNSDVSTLNALYVRGTSVSGLLVDLGLNNDVVQATHDNFNANANIQVGDVDVSNSNPVPISDAGGSLTIDNSTLAVVGGGTEATALRVTIANNSTGLVSIDDNGDSLTIDNPILSVTGNGTATGAQRVTIEQLHGDIGVNWFYHWLDYSRNGSKQFRKGRGRCTY